MIGEMVEFEDLKKVTGYTRLSDVERCLNAAGVRFFRGKGGIWTTLALINAAAGIAPGMNVAADDYSPDMAA